MSYIEHGPRIFLAGRANNDSPLIYGDYVIPRKRLEGRLKVYESCADIRAWSPNPLESSRYFRELAEHSAPPGKIIPFNVVIDNIIGLTSQAQHQVHVLQKQLERYKALELTPEQEDYLRSFEETSTEKEQRDKETESSNEATQLQSISSLSIDRAFSFPHVEPYLSPRLNIDRSSQTNTRNYQSNSLFDHIDLFSGRTACFLPKLKSLYIPSKSDDSWDTKKLEFCKSLEDKYTQSEYPKYVDVASQIIQETQETESQTHHLTEKNLPVRKSHYKYSDKERYGIETEYSFHDNVEIEDLPYESFCSDSESDSESLSDSDFEKNICKSSYREMIIQKESNIIALKNEIHVKEAEIEEISEMNKELTILLKKKDQNLNALQETLKLSQEQLAELNKQLHSYECQIDQLKNELDKRNQISHIQSQEIEKLNLHVVTLLKEKEAFANKAKNDVERLTREAESYRETLKLVSKEKETLEKQCLEQRCTMSDQSDEIERLLTYVQELSSTNNERRHKLEGILEGMNEQIVEKETVICRYEEQLHSMEQEISDFTKKLKNSLNSLGDFQLTNDDLNNPMDWRYDSYMGTQYILHALTIVMEELKRSKVEKNDLLQQIDCLRKPPDFCNSLSSLADSKCDSNYASDKEVQVKNFASVQLDVENEPFEHVNNKVEMQSNKDASDLDAWESANTELSLSVTKSNENLEDIEVVLVEQVSQSLMKIQSLMDKLEAHAQSNPPSLIRQIGDFCRNLMNLDAAARREKIGELYEEFKNQYEKCKPYITILTKELKETPGLPEFAKTFLCQQLQEIVSCDEQLDRVFTTHMKRCIEKINEISFALQGAGDHCMQIVQEVAKQQREILQKDSEIARLKKEVEKGEGDCQNQEKSEFLLIKENFQRLHVEMNRKDEAIEKLRGSLKNTEERLLDSTVECDSLKMQNQSLIDTKNSLMKERESNDRQLKSKNDEINKLTQQLQRFQNTMKILKSTEMEIEELRVKLTELQGENNELRKKLKDAMTMVKNNHQRVLTLENELDKTKESLIATSLQYESKLNERQAFIMNLENKNFDVIEKLVETEGKITALNETISLLREENDKMRVIEVLQENLTRLNDDIKRLEIESSKRKNELQSYQESNRRNERKLEKFLRENEEMKKNIEVLKEDYSNLMVEPIERMAVNEGMKDKLCNLPSKIYEKIIMLKKQLQATAANNLSESKPGTTNKQTTENKEVYVNLLEQNEEVLERLEILKTENAELLEKLKNLSLEVEQRDSEIESLKESMNKLSKENEGFSKKLKEHNDNYQDKLAMLKKKYDSSISALHKRHKENIEHLKINFEEMNGEKYLFDSEGWLKSLTPKELAELQNRIRLLTSKLDTSNEYNKEKANSNVTEKIGKFNNEVEQQREKGKLLDGKAHRQEVHLSGNSGSSKNSNKLQSKYQNKGMHQQQQDVMEKSIFFDPSVYQPFQKQGPTSRGYDKLKKAVNKNAVLTPTKANDTLDWQRKNFIYQCSVNHKKNNVC